MSRSSSAVERGPDEVSSGGLLPGAPTPAGRSGEDRLRVVEGSDHSPDHETPPIGDLRLVLVTATGVEFPLVASPAQTARLLRSSGEAGAADQQGDGDSGCPLGRRVCHPRRVPVEQLLSRSRLISRFEAPLCGGAA